MAATLAGLATIVVAVVPTVRLAYRSPGGHLVLETLVATIGGLAALLLYGRFRRSRALRDLLLVNALSVLAVAALFLVAIPMVAGAEESSAITTWAPLLVRMVGAGLLLAAALAGSRRVATGARPLREALVLGGVLVALAVVVQLLDAFLPTAVTALPPPEESARPRFEGHPVVLVVQGANLVCYAVASVLFTREGRRTGDDLIGWIAAAAAVGAWARVNYLLFPSIYSEWLYTGDVLRLGFYLLLLVGAVREVRAYWAAQAESAVSAERRRLARDLHDGAVQELGYIRRLASTITSDRDTASKIDAAAERALDETRRAVAALTAPVDEPLAQTVRRAVHEVGSRFDVPVTVVDRYGPAAIPGDRREALVRIAREAVSNAARHGRPRGVTVTLLPRTMHIEDDGTGFDPDRPTPGRFGLTSMRDRAEGMGGEITVDSAPGKGTRVTVTW